MRKLILVVALVLSACASKEEIAQKQASEDHAFCHSVWGFSQEGYANCRMRMEHQRFTARQNGAALSTFMGMQLLQQQQQQQYRPAPTTTTCTNQGVFTNCTSH